MGPRLRDFPARAVSQRRPDIREAGVRASERTSQVIAAVRDMLLRGGLDSRAAEPATAST